MPPVAGRRKRRSLGAKPELKPAGVTLCPLCPKSLQLAGAVDAEVVGALEGPAVGTPGVTHRFTAHHNCIIWCPEVAVDEDGHLLNVDKAVRRAVRIKCKFCGEKGASIGCWQDKCPNSYHLACAYNPKCDVDMVMPDMELWCPRHAEGPAFRAHEALKRRMLEEGTAAAAEGAEVTRTPTAGAASRMAPSSGRRDFRMDDGRPWGWQRSGAGGVAPVERLPNAEATQRSTARRRRMVADDDDEEEEEEEEEEESGASGGSDADVSDQEFVPQPGWHARGMAGAGGELRRTAGRHAEAFAMGGASPVPRTAAGDWAIDADDDVPRRPDGRPEGIVFDEMEWKHEIARRLHPRRRVKGEKASKMFSHILADVNELTVTERQRRFKPITGEALERFVLEAEPYTTKVPQDAELREQIPRLMAELAWIEARPNLYLCESEHHLYLYTRTDVWGWYADIRAIAGASHPHMIKVITKPRLEHRLSFYLRWTLPNESVGSFRFSDPYNTSHAFRDNVMMMRFDLNGVAKRSKTADVLAHGQCYFPELPTARLWFNLTREIVEGTEPQARFAPYIWGREERARAKAAAMTAHAPTDGVRARAAPGRTERDRAYSTHSGAAAAATAAAATGIRGRWPLRAGISPWAMPGATPSLERAKARGYAFGLDEMYGGDGSSDEETALADELQRHRTQVLELGDPSDVRDRFWPISDYTDPQLRALDTRWQAEWQRTPTAADHAAAERDRRACRDADNMVVLTQPLNRLQELHGYTYANAVRLASEFNRQMAAQRSLLHAHWRTREHGLHPSAEWSEASEDDSDMLEDV
ncbi:hypothetical protein CDCA_CDCA04G1248 [Cyanidium caldarium]|uniref:PHD-type domain-containing protein n=1 Tax=Cyanidium caldarium TaxID=2771 RepID=A0AAV9IT13_CYACA|nr:hypothetical protein CDCA_CDCA04G1248 [Cyanidium caldarium]